MSFSERAADLRADNPAAIPRGLHSVMFGAIYLFLASNYFSIAVNSIALGLIGLSWLAIMIVSGRWSVGSTPLDYYFLAYVVAECLSTAFSYNPLQSLIFSKRLLLICIVYLFGSVITTEVTAKRFVTVLVGSAVAVSLVGVLKLTFGDPAANTRLGIFQFYMTTSELMMIATLLLVPFCVYPGTPKRIRWLVATCLVPVVVCLYATVTRGAYLAAAAGLVFISLVRFRKLVLPVVLVTVVMILFAPPYVENRLRSIVDLTHPENLSRIMLWTTGLRIFAHNPVIGVGDIDLHDLLVRYANPGSVIVWGHLHNTLMQVLVTLGAVGFVVVVAMFVKIAVVEWKVYQRVKGHWFYGSCALGALAVFVGIQVNGITEWSFGDQEVAIMLWTTLGFTLGIGNLVASAQQEIA